MYCGSSLLAITNFSVKSIDFATFHLYTDAWGISANPGGNDWFKNHAAICAAAGKPCVAEEYGIKTNKQAVMSSWQADLRAANGMAGDMFWQWGESLPNWGTTHDDGYTIYYGSSDWQKLVRDHVSSIGGVVTTTSGRVSTTTTGIRTTTTTGIRTTTTTARTTTATSASGGGTVPRWGQCGGIGYTGPKTCASPYTCTYSNDWYSQCL
jgi:mannan endo-1,4-beta-mannosidase